MPDDDEAPRLKPGRPKLRMSCDECGDVKLRCDRGQPKCGRCISHGLQCVYGLSRKMGKPPRHKRRTSPVLALADPVPVTDACDIFEDMMDLGGAFDQPALPLSAFTPLDFTEWSAVDVDHFSTSAFLNTPVSYTSHLTTQPVEPSRYVLATDQISPHNDCLRRAYDLLGKLSMFDDQSFGTRSLVDKVPFDQVLSRSREATELLSELLACSCAACPSLAFLKASIVSKILSWYYQAAACMTVTASHAVVAVPNSVSPANITVGSFSIDDERVQAALKIQLLLGEMKRAGLLIDQFTVHGTSTTCHDIQSNPDSIDRLYQHLTAWLKDEHARIFQIMKSKLRELNN